MRQRGDKSLVTNGNLRVTRPPGQWKQSCVQLLPRWRRIVLDWGGHSTESAVTTKFLWGEIMVNVSDSHDTTTQRRFGNRATIEQPAVLRIGELPISGVISNVGLRGAFFQTNSLVAKGSRGTLTRTGGKAVEVRVVWQRVEPTPGIGLAFDAD